MGYRSDNRASQQPLLLYDGDCAFCQRCVDLLDTTLLGGGSAQVVHPLGRSSAEATPVVAVVPWQSVELDILGVTWEQVQASVIWIDADGSQRTGADAIAALLRSRNTNFARVASAALQLPVIRLAARLVYGMVARNRHRLPGGTQACQTTMRPGKD
ncbi:MAG: DUF393 domain-containing protein [Microthrixaceae bacterium]